MRRATAQIETEDLPLSAVRSPISDLTQQLQDILTQRLVAYIVGLSDGRDIGRYARGERRPHPGTNLKLRELFGLISLMLEKEDPQTVQVWLQGRNPELEDQSPASVLRASFENYPRVKSAIEKFLAAGG
jgi:hypothetical protein